jgi:WD40 repeat protein
MSGVATAADNTMDIAWSLPLGHAINTMGMAPTGAQICVGTSFGDVFTISTATGYRDTALLQVFPEGVNEIQWRPQASYMAVAGMDQRLRIYSADDWRVRIEISVRGDWVEHMAWSPTDDLLAVCSGNAVQVFDTDGNEVYCNQDHPNTVTDICWNQDGRNLHASCYKGIYCHTPAVTDSKPRIYPCLGSLINVRVSPRGDAIIAGSQDRVLQYWKLHNGQFKHAAMSGYPEKVSVLEWSPDGNTIASAGGRSLVLWTERTGTTPEGSKPQVLQYGQSRISVCAFNDSNSRVAYGDINGDVYLAAYGKQQALQHSWSLGSAISTLCWSDNGMLLAGTEQGVLYAIQTA